jgi:hypothetical protein
VADYYDSMYGEYLGNKMGNLGGAAFDKHMIRSICIEDRLQFFKKKQRGRERERERREDRLQQRRP